MLANLEVKWLYDVIALEESRSFTGGQSPQHLSVLVQSTHPVAGGFLDSASSIVAPTLCS